MIILEDLDTIHSPSKPCILTIGSFDGVHLGHQSLLKRMRTLAGPKGTVAVLTFSNHPSEVLQGRTPTPLILTKSLKMKLLEECGVDLTYCLEFTKELSEMGYDTFLKAIQRACPFEVLVLGEGASLGRKREGTAEKMKALGQELGFRVEYLPKLTDQRGIISSGMIRTYLQEGQIAKAVDLLGHPFILEGVMNGDELSLPANMCLPPNGTYSVIAQSKSIKKQTSITIENGKVFLDLPMENQKIYVSFQ